MDQLDPPPEDLWEERRLWFETQEADRSRAGAPAPSEQACALMIDLQAVFCAGAWAAAVILAAAIVESQRKESAAAADALAPAELTWLIRLRNRLLHDDRRFDPVLTIEDQWTKRGLWEEHARRAILAAMASLYGKSERKDG